jgi:hypothetical protein
MVLRSAITASSSATSGKTVSNLPAACGAQVVTCIRSGPTKEIYLPPQKAATVGWRKEKSPFRKLSGLQTREGVAENEVAENTQDYNGEFYFNFNTRACPSRRRSEATQRNSSSLRHIWSRHNGTHCLCGLTQTRTAENRSVISGSKCEQFVSGQNVKNSGNGGLVIRVPGYRSTGPEFDAGRYQIF